MHQPPDNLLLLREKEEFEAKQIAHCYERPARFALKYKDVANFHIGFSGILLEQMLDTEIKNRYLDIIDFGKVLESYHIADNIEFLGMGYYHPVFPLIPMEDWEGQIKRWQNTAKKIFGERKFQGFWPPEMGFCMEMIPVLEKTGFKYVVVDGVHILPEQSMTREEVLYKPHIASYDDSEIIIIPRDRDLSNAQQSGLNPDWFTSEIKHKTRNCTGACLVTTWSDGENGGWFRNLDENANFWGYYFAPYMNRIRSGRVEIKPVKISDFIEEHPPQTYVKVRTGAWNVGTTSGYDFSQWSGSANQKKGLEELWQTSKLYHDTLNLLRDREISEEASNLLAEAEEYIMRAETSCNFFWGESWIPRVYRDTELAKKLIKKARVMLGID